MRVNLLLIAVILSISAFGGAFYLNTSPSQIQVPAPLDFEILPDARNPRTESGDTILVIPPRKVFQLLAVATSTVEAHMQAEQARGALSYTSAKYPMLGTFVESINGTRNANGKYWILYVDDTPSSVGMSSASVVPGTRIEWRYE